MADFDYKKAFSRNIGWVTEEEQLALKGKTVAICGAGGVGGEYAVTLARLGIGNFKLADYDEFEVHNFNRQAGAFMSTIGQSKCKVMQEVVNDINPEANVHNFPKIDEHNVDEFLEGADVYVDGLDLFAMGARKLVFAKCHEKGIPVMTIAPVGMGAAFLCFMPGKMGYEEYFRFNDVKSEDEQCVKFIVGLSPSLMQKAYLVDPTRTDFVNRQAPSTPMGVKACASLAGSNVLKFLLGRGKIVTAPFGIHFDGYMNKSAHTWCPFGNRGLIQRIKYKAVKGIVLS